MKNTGKQKTLATSVFYENGSFDDSALRDISADKQEILAYLESIFVAHGDELSVDFRQLITVTYCRVLYTWPDQDPNSRQWVSDIILHPPMQKTVLLNPASEDGISAWKQDMREDRDFANKVDGRYEQPHE